MHLLECAELFKFNLDNYHTWHVQLNLTYYP